jgi:DNA ligase (NAD+)
MNKVEELVNIIKDLSKSYYQGNSVTTDDQFDYWIKELKSLDPSNPILSQPGFGAFEDWKIEGRKYPHKFGLVGSLEKVDSVGDIENPVITKKYDGSSITVEYINGSFKRALTRGNGKVGIDVSQHVSKFVPTNIPWTGQVCFRCEALIKTKTFEEKYSKEYSNSRNMVSGVLNSLEDTEIVKDFSAVFYSVLGGFCRIDSKIQVLEFIKSQNLETADVFINLNNVTEADLNKWRLNSEYLTDGIVITENKIIDNKEISVAYKFESETKQVVVKDVEWNTGIKGHITPLIVYDPVELSGAMLSAATAHNGDYVVKNNIGKGAIVEITRSGEVIPYIKSVIKGVSGEVPDKCPSCQTPTEWKGSYLNCPNIQCNAKSRTPIFNLVYFAGQPDGVASSILNDWLDQFPVNEDFSDIQDIDNFIPLFKQSGPKSNSGRLNVLINKFGDHRGKLLHQVEKNIEIKLENGLFYKEFWFMINIPGLSEANANKLGKYNPTTISMLQIEESKVSKNVVDSLALNQNHWMRISKMFKLIPTIVEESTYKFKVVVTGSLSVKRDDWVKTMISKRILVVSAISKDVKYLVCNSDKKSSKSKAAEKLGIKVVNEQEFNDILNNKNIQ